MAGRGSALVMKALSADRQRRFASATEMRAALERHRPNEPLADVASPYATPRSSQLEPLRDAHAGTMRARPPMSAPLPLQATLDGLSLHDHETVPSALDDKAFAEAEPVALELDRAPPPSTSAPPSSPRKLPLGLIAVLALLLGGGGAVAFLIQRTSPHEEAAPLSDRVQVRVMDLPRGAKVYLDNLPSAPSFTIGGSRETHRLRLEAPGYADKALLFTPDANQTIDGRMTKSR